MKLAKNSLRPTIILKIGCDPEAAENMIRLAEPSISLPVPDVDAESAVKYITGGKTGYQSARTDHHAAKKKS
jgi:hypothetical protein